MNYVHTSSCKLSVWLEDVFDHFSSLGRPGLQGPKGDKGDKGDQGNAPEGKSA